MRIDWHNVIHVYSLNTLQFSGLGVENYFMGHMSDHAVRPNKFLPHSTYKVNRLLVFIFISQLFGLQKFVLNPRSHHIILDFSDNFNLPVSFHFLIVKVELLGNVLNLDCGI